MKNLFLFSLVLLMQDLFAQHIGIGTNTPRSPLSFGTTLGQKISLWDNGNTGGNNYGLGIQHALIQIHTDSAKHDIVYGTGGVENFSEKIRFTGTGKVGVNVSNPGTELDVAGNIRLRSYDINTAALMGFTQLNNNSPVFMGQHNDSTLGIYTYSSLYNGPSLTMNTNTGAVGIKYATPKAPLSFAPELGYKISLKQDANGNTGTAGQILVSQGAGSPAIWKGREKAAPVRFQSYDQLTIADTDYSEHSIPGLRYVGYDHNAVSKRLFQFGVEVESVACVACPPTEFFCMIHAGTEYSYFYFYVRNGEKKYITGKQIMPAGATSNVTYISIRRTSGPALKVGSGTTASPSFMYYEFLTN
ncbi:MAG: hypothetical protein EOP53_18130 [Sphingobacteriales bacterium]|nr:MAG: hypothetical protein EOP53_18130 [Sphingobacteriales bacterium]